MLRLKGKGDDDEDEDGDEDDDDEEDDEDSDENEAGASGSKPKEVLDIQPLAVKVSKLTHILDMQGVIQHSVSYDKEEGEIIHCLTKEQIVELLAMNPIDVVVDDEPVKASDVPTPESPSEEFDEVEIEDVTEETYPTYQTGENEDLPNICDLFNKQSEEELNRKIDEKT